MTTDVSKWGLDPDKLPAAVLASDEPIVRFFAWHDAHPVALTMVLMEKFKHEWIEWEPEVLKSEILKTFNATSISDNNWNKIQAIRTLFTSVSFWQAWEVFEKVIQALNNNVPHFNIMQKCTLSQLMAGVDIANRLRESTFEEEVIQYVAACALDQGVTYLPPPLDFSQEVLSYPQYLCKDCGNVDHDDLSDGRCDFCVARYQDHHNLNGKPAPWIPENVGRNIYRFMTRNPDEAKKKYEEIKDLDSYPINDESSSEVQAAKLVVAYKYMQNRRAQLVEQLRELRTWVSH